MAFGEFPRLCLRAAKTGARNSIATILKTFIINPPKLDLNVLNADTEGKLEKSVNSCFRAPRICYTWRCRYMLERMGAELPEHFILPIEDFEIICIWYTLTGELIQAEEKIAR